MGEDLLDHRLLQDRRNDPQLAAAVRAVLHRQDVKEFTARPLESDDHGAAAAEYPLMAGRAKVELKLAAVNRSSKAGQQGKF